MTTKDENELGEQSFVFKEIGAYFRRSTGHRFAVVVWTWNSFRELAGYGVAQV